MPNDRLPDELMKALMSTAKYGAWQRQQETSREFWRTLQGPAQRPLGSNADEWNLFIAEQIAENQNAAGYLAVQIAEAIEEAERRGSPLRLLFR